MSDWSTVLDVTERELGAVAAIYEKALRAKTLPPELLVKVKNVVENQRSALDYIAHDVTRRFGHLKPKTKVYYPFAPTPAKFNESIDARMPGVRASRPDLADIIEERQPYKLEPLRWLEQLVNPNKHIALTPQTRTETREVAVTDRSGGLTAVRGDVVFGPVGPNGEQGIAFGPGGSISFGPGGVIGFGPDHVTIQGAPVDPRRQRPVPTAPVRVAETIYVDWNFDEPARPALDTLRQIQDAVREVVGTIENAA